MTAVVAGRRPAEAGLAGLALTALGIVYGDIGTSPLYTLKTVIDLVGGKPTAETALGILSLIVWTLVIITSVKYVAFVMQVDNDGEGGILALMSLLGVKRRHRPAIIVIGLFGAALIYGDGAITPAISVLSALEGLKIAAPGVAPYVLPATVAVLVGLFVVQSQGTERIGAVFGPVMLLWFVTIALLGAWGVAQHPHVLVALDPRHAVGFLRHNGFVGFAALGGVFLCVTGAEALYADMGHVGKRAIRLTWHGVVLPALVLSYAGQTAIVVSGGPISDNIFYRLCPAPLLLPLIGLSTVATIIASQSIITGAFSMTRQAIQLGWMPRVHITQTSAQGYGQIYVGAANWILMLATVGLAVSFGSSDRLAAAYGIAVSLTMLLTTALLFVAMREIWHWNLAACVATAGLFFCVDGGFFAANLLKVKDGGWVPLALAAAVFTVLGTWHRGSMAMTERILAATEPVDSFLARVAADSIARVPGTAVFLTRATTGTPPVMLWHVRQSRALQRVVVAITFIIESVPWTASEARIAAENLGPDYWHLTARFGFMERPDIPALLADARHHGCTLDLADVTYYVGHETVLHRGDGGGLPQWQESLFALMQRNATHVGDFFRLPCDQVVEIGRQIEI